MRNVSTNVDDIERSAVTAEGPDKSHARAASVVYKMKEDDG